MTKEEFTRCRSRCQDRCFECNHLQTAALDGEIFYICAIDEDLLKPGACCEFKPWRIEE